MSSTWDQLTELHRVRNCRQDTIQNILHEHGVLKRMEVSFLTGRKVLLILGS